LYEWNSLHGYSGVRRCLQSLTTELVALLHPYAVAEIWKLYERNSLHGYSGVRRCLQSLTTELVAFLHANAVAKI
jgi:hypothetical protein